MIFFIPGVEDEKEAEVVYRGIIERGGFRYPQRKIYSIQFNHLSEASGQESHCSAVVGERLAPCFGAIGLVIAIIDTPAGYLIYTRDRGLVIGEPILVDSALTNIVFFDKE